MALTTNGTGLARLAPALAEAGLRRVNVSCDSLRAGPLRGDPPPGRRSPPCSRRWTPPKRPGFTPVKINVVLMAGRQRRRGPRLRGFARQTGRIVRFIEFMPLDAGETWRATQVVPGEEILARIDARWPLEPVERRADRPGAGRPIPLRRRRRRDRRHLQRDRAVLRHLQPAPADG